jgi:hypothetical protein
MQPVKPPAAAPSKTQEALKESANLVVLGGAVVASAVLLNPAPLIAIGVLEAAYLLLIPKSKWFDAHLAAKYDRQAMKHREQLKAKVFIHLSSDLQMRFSRLETLRTGIAKESFDGRRWYREVVRKLDHLMEKFLLFGSKKSEFVSYLISLRQETEASPKGLTKSTSRSGGTSQDERADDEWVNATVGIIQKAYLAEIAQVEQALGTEQNLHNQAVLNKRHEVLDRRQQYVSQIGEILLNIGHQIRLIEDTFGLINDEIRARSPDQVLADIDDVVFQTDNLSETLQEVSPFDSMAVQT